MLAFNGFFNPSFDISKMGRNGRNLSSNLIHYLSLLLMVIVSVSCQSNPITPETVNDYITAHAAIIGVITIIVGLFLCFLGFRLFKIMLFLITWTLIGVLIYVVMVNAQPAEGYKNQSTTLLLVPLACGFVAACLVLICLPLAISLVGALAGLVLALYIIQWTKDGMSETARIVLMVVLPILGALLAQFFTKIMSIVFTAFIGSYMFFYGLDCFIHTGFRDSLGAALNGELNEDFFLRTKETKYMLGSMIVLFFIGMLVQFLLNRKRYVPNLDNKYRRKCCPCC